MPPAKKYRREEIIDAALKIVEKEGLHFVNARKVASNLGCSVQPIFHNFANMGELEEAVFARMYDTYREYMTVEVGSEKAYKQTGIGYITFAKEHPEFFKALFMQKTKLDAEAFIMADRMGEAIIKTGQELTGLSYELQKKFHVKVWIFTHGIACLVAAKTISISDVEISVLLEKTVREMLIGFMKEEGLNK